MLLLTNPPVVKGAQLQRNTLNSPCTTAVRIENIFDWWRDAQFLLNGEEVVLPGSPTLCKTDDLPAAVNLKINHNNMNKKHDLPTAVNLKINHNNMNNKQ